MKHTYMNKTLALVCALGLSVLMTACGDADDWQPGDAVAAGVQGAYFSPNLTTAYSTAEDPEFSITVSRLDTTAAASVGIRVVSTDTAAIEIPTSVTFEKGQSTAQLTCRAEGLTPNENYKFTIAIADADINPYVAGTVEYTGTVLNGKLWSTVAEDVYFYFSSSSTMPTYYSTIEQYVDQNRFRIVDFMGSGVDWEFTIDPELDSSGGTYTNTSGDVSTWMGYVNFDENHYVEYNGWYYFSPDKDNDVYGWTVPGWTKNYATFAVYPGYTYISFGDKYLYTWAYGMLDDAAETDCSGWFYGSWNYE